MTGPDLFVSERLERPAWERWVDTGQERPRAVTALWSTTARKAAGGGAAAGQREGGTGSKGLEILDVTFAHQPPQPFTHSAFRRGWERAGRRGELISTDIMMSLACASARVLPHLWPQPVSEGSEGEAADVGARGLAPHEQCRVKEKVGEALAEGMGWGG